eukprot:Nk52_evm1s736 gene=Nk52_evmTU1s736
MSDFRNVKITNDIVKSIQDYVFATVELSSAPLDKEKIIKLVHGMGHYGPKATTRLIRNVVNWPSLKKDVKRECNKCKVCQRNDTNFKKFNVPLLQKPSLHNEPFKSIQIDIIVINSESEEGYKYILDIVDVATNYTVLVPLRTKEKEEVAEALFNNWICRFGAPTFICSDNGGEFANSVIDAMKE